MEKKPNSEVFVEKCYTQKAPKVKFIRAISNSQLDEDGVDFLVDFRVKIKSSKADIFFPLTMKLQVKIADGEETVGLVLPLEDPLPKSLAKRVSPYMLKHIGKHLKKHPHVNCILFVSRLSSTKSEEQVVEEIWRETKKMFNFIKRHYFNEIRHFK